MKKIFKLLLFAAIAIVATPLLMYAQDTTLVNGVGSDLLKTVIGGVATQYPILGLVGTGLFVVSELLGTSKKVAANSVFQVIAGLVKTLFGK